MFRAVVFILLALVVSDAYACSRCGLFGRRCRFLKAVPVVKAIPVAQRQDQVIVIQNNNPLPIAAQGQSYYSSSYQLAAAQYAVDPAVVLQQAYQLTQGAQTLAAAGLTGFESIATTQLHAQASVTERLAKGIAAEKVLQAADLDTAHIQQSQTLALQIYRDASGKWQVEGVSPKEAAEVTKSVVPTPPTQEQPTPTSSILATRCAKCHGLQLASPKAGVYLDGGHPLSGALIVKSLQQVRDDKMPKDEPKLSAQEKGQLMEELLGLLKE